MVRTKTNLHIRQDDKRTSAPDESSARACSENNEVVDMRMRIIARKVLLHGHCYCHGNPNKQDVALIEQKVKFHKNYYLCI